MRTQGLLRFPSPSWSPLGVSLQYCGCGASTISRLRLPPSRRRASFLCCSSSDGSTSRESELELLGKPYPVPISDVEEKEINGESESPEIDAALAPFLKFFKTKESAEEDGPEELGFQIPETFVEERKEDEIRAQEDETEKVAVEYYDPKSGDFVVGVIVSGNENKLDVSIGADRLGTMLTKEALPLHEGEMARSLCDLEKDTEEFMVPGRIGVVKEEEALTGESTTGRPVLEVGSLVFAEVLGRTLSGRPLLSARRLFRRIAWHRVRQIERFGEPIDVTITEWNTGGLLTRIEGLRAFLPKAELMNRVSNFSALKENVGRRISVCVTKIDEEKNDLIISEREAWDLRHLQEGTLLEGTVRKIFPFGAQVRIGDTNRSGLLHISNISRARIESVEKVLQLDEKVKVLVVKSLFPDKISLSIADLEGEPGLILSNKERVFAEAEQMARRYRQKLNAVPGARSPKQVPVDSFPFGDEARLYSNWNWFKFERNGSS